MSSTPTPRRLRRLAAVAAGVLAFGTAAVAVPTSASAATQPVTVVTTVNGGPGSTTYTGDTTTVNFAVTNAATNGAKLGAFGIVVPPGLGAVTKAGPVGLSGVNAAGNWIETIAPCGSTANCSAIVLVNAWFPLRSSLVAPGGTVTASITFKAPLTAGQLNFPLVGIGGGIFTVSGPTPSISVIDAAAATLGVVVAPVAPATSIVAGAPATVTVSALNGSGGVVPFKAGTLTLTLGTDDGGAGITTPATATPASTPLKFTGKTLTFTAAASSGPITLPAVFTKAAAASYGAQSVTAVSGAVTGTSLPFDVRGAAPTSLVLSHVDANGLLDGSVAPIRDTSQTPALPTPAAGQAFTVDFAALDTYGNVSPTVVPATLAVTGTANGALTPAAPTASTGSNGAGTFPVTYSAAQNGLTLTVTAPSLPAATGSVSGTTNVSSAGAAGTGTPGTKLDLAAGGVASSSLGNGAYGSVFLTVVPCTLTGDPTCTVANEVTLDGTFSSAPDPVTGVVTHLYTNDAPASFSFLCDTACPHKDGTSEPSLDYLYNQTTTEEAYAEREQVEDFTAYPIQIALKGVDANGKTVYGNYNSDHVFVEGIYLTAPECRTPGTDVGLTGKIRNPAAQALGFCADVYAFSRAVDPKTGKQSFTGALTRPVLFVEDPKGRTSP